MWLITAVASKVLGAISPEVSRREAIGAELEGKDFDPLICRKHLA